MIRMTIVAVVIAAGIATYGFTRAASTNCDADSSVQPIEAQFVSLLNTYRAQNGSGPLTVSPTLQRSARWMANDLASHNLFSHTDSLGRSFQTRMVQCGATGFLGENVAGGGSTGAFTLWNWQSSPGHNATMLNPNFTEIGIAFAQGGPYGTTWVADFGSAQSEASQAPTPTPLPKECKPAPEYGPDGIVCDGGGVQGWNVLPIRRIPMVARD